MQKIDIKKKAKIDRSVLELACNHKKRFTAYFIASTNQINPDVVRKRLFQLREDNKLNVNYEVICPSCSFTALTIYNEKDIPLGKIFECNECYKEFEVEPKDILVTFTPNKEYYDEECKRIVKKKF